MHSDDLIIASNKLDTLDKTKKQLLQAFDGVDQDYLTSFCGVEVDVQKGSISLSIYGLLLEQQARAKIRYRS